MAENMDKEVKKEESSPTIIEDQLKAFFNEDEIEWLTIAVSPSKGKIKVMPRIKRHCIITRLDAIFGQGNWKDYYEPVGEIAVICRLAVRVWRNEEWIIKADGADREDVEDVMVAAFRKAAEKWGIGLYLHEIPEEAKIIPINERGARYHKSNNSWFRYNDPEIDAKWLPEVKETEELIALKIEIEELAGELYVGKTYSIPERLTEKKARFLLSELHGIKAQIEESKKKENKSENTEDEAKEATENKYI